MMVSKFPQSCLSLALHVTAEQGETREALALTGRAVQSRSGPTAPGSKEAAVCHPPVNEQKFQTRWGELGA
jgi:hypothetical protein